MAKIDEVREFIADKQLSLKQEIESYGNPKNQEEEFALSIYSSQLALLEEISLIVDPE